MAAAVQRSRPATSEGRGTRIGDAVDVARLRRGDRAHWELFVRRASPVIYAAVLWRLVPAGAGQEAEDVAQDVFLRLCKSDFRLLAGFDPARASLSTFLTVVATSTTIDHLRRRRPTQPIDTVPEARLAVDPVEPRERLTIPPDLLSPRQRLVLTLLYDRDMDVAEAAALMQVDAQTVRSMHHKALVRLRAHFARDGKPAGSVLPGEGEKR